MGWTNAVKPIANAPQRAEVELTATLGQGDSFARMLQRAGLGGNDVVAAMRLIGGATGAYDAILLDVDNGPGGLSREENDSLYSLDGLRASAKALKPGGLLAVWSSGPSNEFARRLRTTGYQVEEVRANANRKGKGARHVIWIATKA